MSVFFFLTLQTAFLVLVGWRSKMEISVSVAPYVQCTQVTDKIQNFHVNVTVVRHNLLLMWLSSVFKHICLTHLNLKKMHGRVEQPLN